jgi:hypothetical protein
VRVIGDGMVVILALSKVGSQRLLRKPCSLDVSNSIHLPVFCEFLMHFPLGVAFSYMLEALAQQYFFLASNIIFSNYEQLQFSNKLKFTDA